MAPFNVLSLNSPKQTEGLQEQQFLGTGRNLDLCRLLQFVAPRNKPKVDDKITELYPSPLVSFAVRSLLHSDNT
jgi:hypothetical protein